MLGTQPSHRIIQQQTMAKSRTFRGSSPRRGSRYYQQDRAGMDFEYANDAQSSTESCTTPRADPSTRGLGCHFHRPDQSHDTSRRSSNITPHERRWQSPIFFPPSSPHLCQCDQRYKAIIREIYCEGSIIQQKMERLLARLTPNEDEMDWEAASTTYFVPSKPFPVTQNEADRKARGFEHKGPMNTDSDTAKIAGMYMSGPQGWISET